MWITSKSYELSEMGNEAARSPYDQMFYLAVMSSAFVVASSRGVKWNRIVSANSAIMVLYVYFLLSVCWSGDPTGSLKRIVKDFGLLFVVAIIRSEKNPLQAIGAVYVRCASVLFPLSVVFFKYFPQYSRSYSLDGEIMQTGVSTTKNSLGELIMVVMSLLVWDYMQMQRQETKGVRRKVSWDHLILLLIGCWLLYISKSKTALVCTCICVLLTVKKEWFASKRVKQAALAVALSLPVFLFSSQEFTSLISPLLEALGRDATFTGRTNIWQHITSTTVNPLFGAGYWNFWGGPSGYAISKAMNTTIPNGHCGYLDIYLDGGVVGLVILFAVLVSNGHKLVNSVRNGRDVTRNVAVNLPFLISVITYNLTESSFARMSILWFTTLLMIVEFPPDAFPRRGSSYRHESTTWKPDTLTAVSQ
jgi:O-antigen ligase